MEQVDEISNPKPGDSGDENSSVGDGMEYPPIRRKLNCPDFGDGTHLTQRYRAAILNNYYKRTLAHCHPDERCTDLQFEEPPRKVPKKSIFLAVLLFVCGSMLLILGLGRWWIGKDKGNFDNVLPFIIIGSLMFIPGFYHVRIAFYTYFGVEGYNYEMIPECEIEIF